MQPSNPTSIQPPQPHHPSKSNPKKKLPNYFNKENTHAADNVALNLDFMRLHHHDEERGDLRRSKEFGNMLTGDLKKQPTPDRFNESATAHTHFPNSASQSFVYQGSQHKPNLHSMNQMEFTGGQSNYQNDTLDSNEIRGRKIDSPHLVVMREIQEIDEEDYLQDDIIGFGTGGMIAAGSDPDLQNLIWNSRDLRVSQNLNESLKRKSKPNKQSKSVENKKKFTKTTTKNRMFELKQNKLLNKGTTSSREVRSSMGFHDLLNQLDKDVSIQQSNLVDFKNRTVHDALKLELSGIRKQKTVKNNNYVGKPKSKSKERQDKSKPKTKNQVFQYQFQNQITPEKLHQGPASFLMHSEHGRCLTSHGLNPSSSMLMQKGHTKSQTNLTTSHHLMVNKLTNHPQTASHQRQSNSPKGHLQQIKEFKPIGNIDKLIRDNLKKKGKQEVREKLQKQKSEETLRKKREELELKNTIVRQINKDKTYKKQQQTISHQQQASDQVGHETNLEKLKRAWNESSHFKFKLKNHSQVLDFDKSKSKRFNFKNSRKSYGLEFMDIKREIQDELKTIEEKVYQENHVKPLPSHSATKKLRIKPSKQDGLRSSTELEPTNKPIVVKKDKIRKFMKAKKKELMVQQFQQHKDEVIKAQKMQDNLIKLNDFCKRKLHNKHPGLKLSKKRNATIQVKDFKDEHSKISLKLNPSRDILRQRSQDINDDSSKISTEFYEEYFRLINSIKKEEQTTESIQNKATISAESCDQSIQKSRVKSPKGKQDVQSPVSFNQAQFVQASPNKKRSAGKKTKSKGSMGQQLKTKLIVRPPTAGPRKQQKSTAKKSRAESAPLIQQLNSLNRTHSPSKHRQQESQISESSDRLQYLLAQIVTIQRAYRHHLATKGFYQDQYFHQQSDYDTEYYPGDTVKHIETDPHEEDSEVEDLSEESDQIIIANKQGPDNKVIYMSNINSCSLPQTPKDPLPDHKQIVFEYKVDDQFGSIMSQPIQQISSQPSIFTQEVYLTQEEKKEDDYKLRMLSGSESLVKDFKQRTPNHLALNFQDPKSMTASALSSQSSVRNQQVHQSIEHDHTSQSSQSLFDRNSFQQFTMGKLNQISHNNEFANLINVREQALEYRQRKEGKILKKMRRNEQISPRTYNNRKEALEKWVKVESEDIQKTKKQFQEEWQKTIQMIEDTQKNVDLMRKKMKIDNQKQHHLFNSQSSRNSSSSNLATVQQDKRRSILEEEPPISQRSIRVFNFEPKKEASLIDFLEEKRKEKLNLSVEAKPKKDTAGIYIEDQNDRQILSSSKTSDDFPSVLDAHPEIILNRSHSDQDHHDEVMPATSLEDLEASRPKQALVIQENQSQPDLLIKSLAEESNSSILNETDLNNYFQEQKFSIEDFKSLDKKQLLEDPKQCIEEDDFQDVAKALVYPRDHTSQVVRTEPDLEDDEFDRMEFDRHVRVKTPEEQIPSMFHQHLLFNHTKPGENIKISDILKKTQSLQQQALDSFGLDSSGSQLLFQNPMINQSMQADNQQSTLADQITDELMQMLLSQTVSVPPRIQEQPENQDVFIVDLQQNEKDNKRELIEYRQRYLMDQDMQKVDLYINEVIATMLQSELEAMTTHYNSEAPHFHKQFLQVLTNPVQKNQLDLLNQLQTSEIGSYDHFETAQDSTQFPILPIDLYLEIERLREENQLGNQPIEALENSVVQESVHIMNKAVFDALNESLTKFRPYGIQGEPMPWSNRNRRLQTKVDINSVDTERLFQMVKSDVLRWSQTFSGCIPSQVFSFKQTVEQPETFDEELFQETRERRLAAMLAQEVVETEHQWLNYDFEEAQVKIDLSDMILEHLVEETVGFLGEKNQMKSIVWQQLI